MFVSHKSSVSIFINSVFEMTLYKITTADNEDIDVYTHDDMMLAHTFPKFSEYKRLKGQFVIVLFINCNHFLLLNYLNL